MTCDRCNSLKNRLETAEYRAQSSLARLEDLTKVMIDLIKETPPDAPAGTQAAAMVARLALDTAEDHIANARRKRHE